MIERLLPDDPRFPRELLLVEQPPTQLYLEGDVSLLQRPRVAIIGSRRPSPYGIDVAYEAAKALAGSGAVVVSGMAQGLDTRAHEGALDAEGATIAVLGTGIDVVYPDANRALMAEVREKGLIVSEFDPGVGPRKHHFPRRNRIIAALAHCLLVVEGRIKGGTSNTTKWAAANSHTIVFGVPGRLGDPLAESPNHIIRDGGHIYLHPNDILLRLGLPPMPEEVRLPNASRKEQVAALRAMRAGLSAAEATLFDLITDRPAHVDSLAKRSELEPGMLLAALSSLELQGLITQLPGKHFTLAA